MRVLLVEDDVVLADGISRVLRGYGMVVDVVHNGLDADAMLQRSEVTVAVVDIGVPGIDGFEIVRRLRARGSALPVLLLTARDAIQDRVFGLETGADDYLVKPFALAELLSRVRALARRSYGFDRGTLALRGLALDAAGHRASLHGQPLELTASEFQLLKVLMMRSPKVVTRRVLEDAALPRSQANASNALDVHMANLRRKVGEGVVRTVRGVGYVIDQA